MVMGSTGTVNITPEMMTNALKVIEDYQTTTNNLHTKLGDTVTALIPASFSGNAAEGFQYFYDNNIVPVTGEGLTGLITALQQIMQGTLDAIPAEEKGLDDQLAAGNKNVQAEG